MRVSTSLKFKRIIYPLLLLLAIILIAAAADNTIDSTTYQTPAYNRETPSFVWVNDTTGYKFYHDASASSGMSYTKTTDGGSTWSAATMATDATTGIIISVWYDKWTPGDTTGSLIHIAYGDSSTDFWYYRTLNTSNSDALGAATMINNTFSHVSGSATGDALTITKNESGVLFVAFGADTSDTTGYNNVLKCSSTCTTSSNWVATATNPFGANMRNNDQISLIPLGRGGNVMLLTHNFTTDDIQSKVYYPANNSWDSAWTTIDSNAADSTNAGELWTMMPTIDQSTGNIYLTYGADVGLATADIRSALYTNTTRTWAAKTDVLTNSNTIVSLDTIYDQIGNTVYSIYLRGTAGSNTGLYYKNSTDSMATWSSEVGPVNTTTGDLEYVRGNFIANGTYRHGYVSFLQNTAGNDGLFGTTIFNTTYGTLYTPTAPTFSSQTTGNFWINTVIAEGTSVINASDTIKAINYTQDSVWEGQNQWVTKSIISGSGIVSANGSYYVKMEVKNQGASNDPNTGIRVLINDTPVYTALGIPRADLFTTYSTTLTVMNNTDVFTLQGYNGGMFDQIVIDDFRILYTYNESDSYNISVNGAWTNGTTSTTINTTVGAHGWQNITAFGYNNSGNGSVSTTSLTYNTQLANNLPSVLDVTLLPTTGNLTTNFSVTMNGTDLDGDSLTPHYLWYINGTINNTLNDSTTLLSPGNFSNDTEIYVKGFYNDTYANGSTLQSISVLINGTEAPILSNISLSDSTRKYNHTIYVNTTAPVTSSASTIQYRVFYDITEHLGGAQGEAANLVYLNNSSWVAPGSNMSALVTIPFNDGLAWTLYGIVEDSNNMTSAQKPAIFTSDISAPTLINNSLSSGSVNTGSAIIIYMNTQCNQLDSNADCSISTVNVSILYGGTGTTTTYSMTHSVGTPMWYYSFTPSSAGTYSISSYTIIDDSSVSTVAASTLSFTATTPTVVSGSQGGGSDIVTHTPTPTPSNVTIPIVTSNISTIKTSEQLKAMGDCLASGFLLPAQCTKTSTLLITDVPNLWVYLSSYITALFVLMVLSIVKNKPVSLRSDVIAYGTISIFFLLLFSLLGFNLYIVNYIFKDGSPGLISLSIGMWTTIVTIVGFVRTSPNFISRGRSV